MGRKTKFTKETRENIYSLVDDNMFYEHIALGSGVSEGLLYSWLAKGKELRAKVEDENNTLEYEDLDEQEKEFVDFVTEFYKRETEAHRNLLKDVIQKDKKWVLTKRYQKHYIDETNVNINAKVKTELSWKELVENAKEQE